MVAVVAHQRAFVALRVIELTARKTVVDQQQGAATRIAAQEAVHAAAAGAISDR